MQEADRLLSRFRTARPLADPHDLELDVACEKAAIVGRASNASAYARIVSRTCSVDIAASYGESRNGDGQIGIADNAPMLSRPSQRPKNAGALA
jgi:hypothetical protein